MHGYELKQRLMMLTGHFRPVSDGALYPAIARLEQRGCLIRRPEPGQAAAARMVLSLTPVGEAELQSLLGAPTEMDISDRNRFFTLMAFLKHAAPAMQIEVLNRRLTFLEGGKSFFNAQGKPVPVAEEKDPFRKGMLLIARETSKVEKQWLRETIAALSKADG